jgi:serine/threonine protein kinase
MDGLYLQCIEDINNNGIEKLINKCKNLTQVCFINKGKFGKVYKSFDIMNNKIVAIKHINDVFSNVEYTKYLCIEIILLRYLSQFNNLFLKVYDVILIDSDIYIIMEYINNNLYEFYCKNILSKSQIKIIMYNLLKQIYYLHKINIIHCDLKPQNILIKNVFKLKICDFGLSMLLKDGEKNIYNEIVTLNYRSPELLNDYEYSNKPLDMWSVGCIFSELLERDILFTPSNSNKLKKFFKSLSDKKFNPKINKSGGIVKKHKIQYQKKFTFKIKDDLVANNLINKLLEIDPNKRISAIQALRHPYFSDIYDDSHFNLNINPIPLNEIIKKYETKINQLLYKYVSLK